MSYPSRNQAGKVQHYSSYLIYLLVAIKIHYITKGTIMERLIRPALAASSLSARRTNVPRTAFSAYRCLHNSSSSRATPLPHPTVPGPPPQPPQASEQERLARKKKNADLLQKGQAMKTDPAKPASALRKRFWKEVSVKETPGSLE